MSAYRSFFRCRILVFDNIDNRERFQSLSKERASDFALNRGIFTLCSSTVSLILHRLLYIGVNYSSSLPAVCNLVRVSQLNTVRIAVDQEFLLKRYSRARQFSTTRGMSSQQTSSSSSSSKSLVAVRGRGNWTLLQDGNLRSVTGLRPVASPSATLSGSW